MSLDLRFDKILLAFVIVALISGALYLITGVKMPAGVIGGITLIISRRINF